MKHVVCFSKGLASALVAATVVHRHGTDNVILLNHDISSWTEHQDIKRFGSDIASALGLPITYANINGETDPAKIPDQFDVCVAAKAFKVGNGTELCTNRLKTSQFEEWLRGNVTPGGAICYYGFDAHEQNRVERRQRILGEQGHQTGFPLADGSPDAIASLEMLAVRFGVEVAPPVTYADGWKHANCVGCLKAGLQHWYKVYVERRDIWDKAKWAESVIGYTIHRRNAVSVRLIDLEDQFAAMLAAGVVATEATPSGQFWAGARRAMKTRLPMAKDNEIGDLFSCAGCLIGGTKV